MQNSQDNQSPLFSLLQNSIVQFIAGTLSLLVILKISNHIEYQLIQIIFKSLGYGFFCYLTTPFLIYWLAYASQGILNKKKLFITIALVGFYSYLVWDAYFFFRGAIASLTYNNPSL
ncbi:hypothetical protein NIES4102_05240 [Chondrocystis sp. NIES-4102]|nr:hypothetical protein NIES4102_05240 [Chondrocystis sp. NIES-4102]